MENRLEKSYGGVLSQVTQAIGGLELYAETLNLRLVEAPVMQTDLDTFIAGEIEVKQQKAALLERRTEYHALMASVRTYLFSARDVLKPYYGQRHSLHWNETGFVRSLKVPREMEKLLVLLLSFEAYFIAHPTHQHTVLDVTSGRARSLYDDLTTALCRVNDQLTAWRLAISARDDIRDKLRRHLRALLKELSLCLHPSDKLWTAFGFNKPGQQETPAAPEEVSVSMMGESAALVKWGKTPRARSFRVWKRVVGVDVEPVLAGTSAVPQFTLDELPMSATVELTLSAMNSSGESRRSKMVILVTGDLIQTNEGRPKLE